MSEVHIPKPSPREDSYQLTFADKLIVLSDIVKLQRSRNHILIAGPYVGEFGFELMRWWAYLQALKERYKKIYVISYSGRKYLYKDWDYVTHDVPLELAGYGYGRIGPSQLKGVASSFAQCISESHYDHFYPWMIARRRFKILMPRPKWTVLGEEFGAESNFDVTLHIRNVLKSGSDPRKNFGGEDARCLVKMLIDNKLRVSCIGHPDYAAHIEGAVDMRSEDMVVAVQTIRSSKLIVGQQSGPTHLANLCGKDVVIWADGKWRIDAGLRWNPHGCRINVVSENTFTPAASAIFGMVINALRNDD